MKLNHTLCLHLLFLFSNGMTMLLAKTYTTHSKIICENSSATITCPQSSGQFINVTYANYGRLTSDFCSKNGVTNCRASISYSVVRSKCDALNSCTLTASNSVFTDPCVGTFKYLEVKYTCMDGKEFPSMPKFPDAYVYNNKRPSTYVTSLPADPRTFIKAPYYYSIYNITKIKSTVPGDASIYDPALSFLHLSQNTPSRKEGAVCYPNIHDQASQFCIYRDSGHLYLSQTFVPAMYTGNSYNVSVLIRGSTVNPVIRKSSLIVSTVQSCFPMPELYTTIKSHCTSDAKELRYPTTLPWSGAKYGKKIPIATSSEITISRIFIHVDLLANFRESGSSSAKYEVEFFMSNNKRHERSFMYYSQSGQTGTANNMPHVSGNRLNFTVYPPIPVASTEKFINVSLRLLSPRFRSNIVFNSENAIRLYGSNRIAACPGTKCIDAYRSWVYGISLLRFGSRDSCIVDTYLQEEYLKPCQKSLLLFAPQSVVFYQPITLECKGQSGSLTQIKWFKDDVPLAVTTNVLSLNGQSYEDQGYYRCTAKSSGLLLTSREVLIKFKDVFSTTTYLEITNKIFTADLNNKQSSAYKELSNDVVKSVGTVLTDIPSKRPHNVSVEKFTSGSVIAQLKIYSNVLAQTSVESFHSNLKTVMKQAAVDDKFGSLKISSQSIITLNHEYCMPETTNQQASKGPYSWPMTALQRTAYVRCPNGPADSYATRMCSGNYSSGAVWQSVRDAECQYNNKRTEKLGSLSQTVVNESNAASVALELETLTTNATSLTSDDAVFASETFSNIVALNVTSDKVVDDLLNTASNLLQANGSVLGSSQSSDKALTTIVKGIESLADKIQLPNKTGQAVVKVASGVAIQAMKIDPLSVGTITFAIKQPSFSSANVISNQQYQVNDVAVGISLPETILSDLKSNSPNRLSFVAYKGGEFFQVTKKDALGQRFTDPTVTPNSMVMSAHVKGKQRVNLSQPLKGTFQKLSESLVDKCVFWDFAANDGFGEWSSEGCRKVTEGSRVVCHCDHMTSFAILFDVYAGKQKSTDPVHEEVLGIISFIGIGLSLGGLFLTLLTLALFKRLRHSLPSKILIQLCLSLTLTLICFVIGADMTTPLHACRGFAIAIQYFLLVCFAWMVVEAVNLYLSFVVVMGTYISKFMIKASICAWGLPAIIVGFTAWQRYEEYGNNNYCVVTGYAAYGTLFAPICLAIVINFVAFIMVFRALTNSARSKKITKDQKRSAFAQARIAATFSCILGLTWVFGLFAIADARIVFQYLFCIFNSLQGFTIFYFHVARQNEARNHWVHFLTGHGLNYYRSSLMSTSRGKSVRPPSTADRLSKIPADEKSATLTSNLSMNGKDDDLCLRGINGSFQRLQSNASASSSNL